jgi:hypothetical protein
VRLASKGLGKITLPFRFAEARVTETPDYLILDGIIKEKKVNWTYHAEIEDVDLVNFLILARNPIIVSWIAERTGARLFGRFARAALNLFLHLLGRRRVEPQPAIRSDGRVGGRLDTVAKAGNSS